MGEMKNTKRQFTGCTCGCGTGTWGMYAPGHDAKHVAFWVKTVSAAWGDHAYAEVKWEYALKQLPTEALRSKFRRAMMNRAAKHLASTIQAMQDENWQRQMYLAGMIARVDSAFQGSGPTTIAEAAAAMGLSFRSVNYRNS